MSKKLPLKGKRVVLTRPEADGARFAERLSALGAEVLNIPLIRIVPKAEPESLAEVFREFASYEWLLFTSRNGVQHFMDMFLKAFEDIRSLGFVRLAVVGKGTADALKSYHLRADLVAEEATAIGLADSLQAQQSLDNVKMLVVTGNRNRKELIDKLWESRAIVDTLQVYATELCDLEEDARAQEFREGGADALVFASASAVEAFGEQASALTLVKGARVPVLCSFGPTTTAKMKASGIPLAIEADSPGMEGMVEALVNYFSGSR